MREACGKNGIIMQSRTNYKCQLYKIARQMINANSCRLSNGAEVKNSSVKTCISKISSAWLQRMSTDGGRV